MKSSTRKYRKEFFFAAEDGFVKRCHQPSEICQHFHHLFLASAMRESYEGKSRSWHLNDLGEIDHCRNTDSCNYGAHFLSRREVVGFHKRNFDFSGSYRHLPNSFTSLYENEFADMIEKLGYRVIRNSRKVIGPYEIDVYLPDIEVAFEFNGDFWHSEELLQQRYEMSAQSYHQMKFDKCDQQGVSLGFVWESNWTQDWLTMIDAACEFIQFKRHSPLLYSLNSAPTPMTLHFDSVDRSGMEKARCKISNKEFRKVLEANKNFRQVS